MINSKYIDISIQKDDKILDAFKRMDEINRKLLIVFDNGLFIGLISVGDIQRAIIDNKPLDTKVGKIIRKNIRVAYSHESVDEIKQRMIEFRNEFMPVLDSSGNLTDVIFWEDVFGDDLIEPNEKFDLPVVIMAGGFGTRLRPLTHIIPKPLIPMGDKTMLEHIFERFNVYGCNSFYISVNYKSSLIEFYLNEQCLPYAISYFEEDKPLGTAGSLSLLKEDLNDTFFVSNCDILIEQDYSEILKYHRENKNELTVIAALKSYSIPYGTIDTGENGQLISLNEKPDLTFKINSGMYLLEPHLLAEIPVDKFFHITDLIDKILNRKGNVGVFPVSEKSWKDVGEWDQYMTLLNN